MENNDRVINDIKNLISFYEKLGQTNPQLQVYVNKLYQELNKLTNENKDKNE